MRTHLARLAGTAVLAVALSGAAVPAASADVIVTPPTIDFGSYPIGATSTTQNMTLTVTCNTAMSCAPDPYQIEVASASPQFTVTSDCPAGMPGVTMAGDSCTMQVTFVPNVPGPQGALIETGEHPLPPPPEPGTTGQVFGYGICSVCFAGTPPTPGPGQAVPAAVPTGETSKKCKKKKKKSKAAAAKKCKKKKKKK